MPKLCYVENILPQRLSWTTDGVILTGGEDLQEYGGPEDSRDRDAFERGLVEYCTQQGLPVMGVCRGMQLLNVCHGGELATVQGHVGEKHDLEILDPEFLGADGLIQVNSIRIEGLYSISNAISLGIFFCRRYRLWVIINGEIRP